MTVRTDTDAVAAGVLELLALGDTPDLNTVLDRIVRAARRQSSIRDTPQSACPTDAVASPGS